MNTFHGDAHHVIQAGTVGTIVFNGPPPPPPRPAASLPSAPGVLIDRDEVLTGLTALAGLDLPQRLALITGLRGAGKTATSLHWARGARASFPDGILYHDFAAPGAREDMGPGDVLGVLLRELGMPAGDAGGSYAARLAAYRSLTNERGILLILDNVRHAGQVEDLIPASAGAVVIVTTHRDLSELAGRYGARVLALRELPVSDALLVLEAVAGADRLRGAPEAARELAALCGCWPLHLRLAAGRLLARPDLPVARVVARLAAARSRVEGDWNIVDDGAYEELPEKLRRAYRILGLHPGGGGREWATGETRGTAPRGPVVSFGLNAGAALLGVSEDDAEDLIDGLVDVQLLDVADGRYAMHDLVRLHAARRAAHEDSVAVREAAVLRAIEWYLRAAVIADTAVNPHRAADAFGPLYPALREQSPFTGEKAALAWLDAERPNLCAALFAAADRERHDLVWQMCEALWGLFFSLKYYDTWIATHRAGLESARRTGDPRPVFRVGIQLGRALYETRRFADAHEVLAEALTAATEIGDARHEATALEFIGRAHLDAGDAATAGDFIARALELEETAGRTRGVAIDLHHMGRVHLALGQFEAAAGCLERAAELFARVADPYNRARVLLTHGRLRTRAGTPDLDILREALATMRDQGRAFQEAEVLTALSEAATATGDVAAGRTYREAAIAAYRRVGSAKAEEL